MDGTVLVADDDRTIRTVLTQALTRAGCKVHATSSLTTLMRWVGEGKGDVVITDVVMPDGNGLEMLPKIAQDRPELPVIVISAQNTIMTAIKAADAQAYDYLPKPFDLPDLMKRTARALERSGTPRRMADPRTENDEDDLPMVGRTAVMQALYRVIARVMNADLPVLIWGENGTGKSLIARAIHDLSDRRSMPFVTVTEADLRDIEGPAKVMAKVRGGTLLIDEIGDISGEIQARIARMMDAETENPPRFIATSQTDLGAESAESSMRPDVYYRLSGATLHVPALRDRVEDIPLLASHFLEKADAGNGAVRELSEGATKILSNYTWPGNVRQLEHAMRQLALTSRAAEISAAEAGQVIGGQPGPEPTRAVGNGEKLGASVERHIRRYFELHGNMLPPPGLYQRILREVEAPLLEVALAATSGNQAKCAELLGINRNTLRKKITDLEIEVTRGRKMM
ncbi:sigma-54-dependent transcriptional regulator [Sulfitobacter donghicola]|uniref:DNA-binding transcriptional regulator NtrC n=1 Tax=Sulfitobacter donghicola DSW-25 = KCTC 12864 = JCM 14565 TaxID=1300350 RepID=A0A073IF71_9RHOB|nr:sigma-54 dependent transcriptional regulator [Sulfitobacter donghicola]KEJ88414.1 chemotaxis protein CheY [Sulfitobacter donghicola DSW-25 = KCTC 12864 = JCM 14565]KIN69719.1 Nitrogen regulation protein [Sulfitobacter donghicola DSW-25 = KCTC 12864 = JCM 14565]